jgi:hypothetical protein
MYQYLKINSKKHDASGHQKIGGSQRNNQIIGDRLQGFLPPNSQNDHRIALKRRGKYTKCHMYCKYIVCIVVVNINVPKMVSIGISAKTNAYGLCSTTGMAEAEKATVLNGEEEEMAVEVENPGGRRRALTEEAAEDELADGGGCKLCLSRPNTLIQLGWPFKMEEAPMDELELEMVAML